MVCGESVPVVAHSLFAQKHFAVSSHREFFLQAIEVHNDWARQFLYKVRILEKFPVNIPVSLVGIGYPQRHLRAGRTAAAQLADRRGARVARPRGVNA
jgi:hypothetical protein